MTFETTTWLTIQRLAEVSSPMQFVPLLHIISFYLILQLIQVKLKLQAEKSSFMTHLCHISFTKCYTIDDSSRNSGWYWEDAINQWSIARSLLTSPVDNVNIRVRTRKPHSSKLKHKMSQFMLIRSLPWLSIFFKFCVDLATKI